MRTPLFASTFALSVLAAGDLASAQESGLSGTSQPPAQQSAPSDSSHAPGHDAQTGKPSSGEVQNTQPYAGSGQTRSQAETMGGAATERLDVPPAGVKQ
jgi:hypothetical protein